MGKILNYKTFMSKLRRWTKEEDLTIITICNEYKTVAEIAKILGRSENAIFNRKSTLGIISKDKKTNEALNNPQKIEQIRLLCEAGMKRKDIAIVAMCEKLKITNKYDYILKRKTENKNKRYKLETALRQKINFGKRKCIKREMDFDIDLEFVTNLYYKQGGKCYYTGELMSWRPNDKNSLSIDRLDSNKGYLKNNIVLCIWAINRMKQETEINLFIELCGRVATNNFLNPQIEYFI